MFRRIIAVVAVAVVGVSFCIADEIRATISKVDGNKVTFTENKGKGEKGDEQTLPLSENAKILSGKFDKETKKRQADIAAWQKAIDERDFSTATEDELENKIVIAERELKDHLAPRPKAQEAKTVAMWRDGGTIQGVVPTGPDWTVKRLNAPRSGTSRTQAGAVIQT